MIDARLCGRMSCCCYVFVYTGVIHGAVMKWKRTTASDSFDRDHVFELCIEGEFDAYSPRVFVCDAMLLVLAA